MCAMPDSWWDDDIRLLEEMCIARAEALAVPATFVAAGKAVFVEPDLDAELAMLIFDSEHSPALTRADTAMLRGLTFTSPTVTIQLELSADGVMGQVDPATEVLIEVLDDDGVVASGTSDDLGFFRIDTVPRGRFRLRCHGAGLDVVTSWVSV
jgi:hypothetical protein